MTNLSAWLSGIWFDIGLVGGVFQKAAEVLPFIHAVELEKALFMGDFKTAGAHILITVAYAVVATGIAVVCFIRQMKNQ